ncbi:hypothetical protein RDV78_01225 [Bacillota bacterium LX-D]|nr:hypothetical protein [Bacillota bacterium LX-D]
MKKNIYLFLFLLSVFVLCSFTMFGCAQKSSEEPKPQVQTENKQNVDRNNEVNNKEENNKEVNNKDKIQKKASVAQYFPLTAGSTWEYQGEGNEYASFRRKVLFSDGNFAQIREDNGGTVMAMVLKITEDGIYRVFSQPEAYNDVNLLKEKPNDNTALLKAPLKVGTKWTEPNGEREIVNLKAEVSTPAGKFDNCLKVKISGANSSVYEYYKQDIGMVYREFVSGDVKVTSSLRKYNIVK